MLKPAQPKKESKKLARAIYNQLKTEVYKREQNNFSRLFLFSREKDWYKMSGNSLLIFINEIAPKVNLKPNILPDTDYTDAIFEEGIITFHSLDSIKKKLDKAGVVKNFGEKENVAWFELKSSVTKKRMDEYRELLKEDHERAIAILRPKVILAPELYTKMRHVLKRAYEINRKMNTFDREIGGEIIVSYAKEIITSYLSMNKGLLDEQTAWLRIARLVEQLQIELSIGIELKYIDQKSAISVGSEVVELKKLLKRELNHRNVIPEETR